MRYNNLFKWLQYVNSLPRTRCDVDDEPFHPTTFTKNRERLMEADSARVKLSSDQFTFDGTLIEV